jgi:hypothetical protein
LQGWIELNDSLSGAVTVVAAGVVVGTEAGVVAVRAGAVTDSGGEVRGEPVEQPANAPATTSRTGPATTSRTGPARLTPARHLGIEPYRPT